MIKRILSNAIGKAKNSSFHSSVGMQVAAVFVFAVISGSVALVYDSYQAKSGNQPTETAVLKPEITHQAPVNKKPETQQSKPDDKPSPTSSDVPSVDTSPPSSLDSIFVDLNQFGSKYGIKFINKGQKYSDKYKWSKIPDSKSKQLENYAEMFKYEFSKYPPEWVKKIGLRNIYLSINVTNVYSVAAIPGSPDSMIYSIEHGTGDYARGVLHHEFHHFVDYYRFGGYYHSDSSWNNLNQAGFKYGEGGFSAYEDGWANSEHPEDGFVTTYAMTGAEEDRAETFAYIMVDERSKKIFMWDNSDTVLKNKVNYMKNKLTSESTGFSRFFK